MAERAIDSSAIEAQLRRLLRNQQTSGAGPWLHAEIARRMGERLALIRMRPQQILEWWGGLGCSDDVLVSRDPDARRFVVEPDAGWAAQTRAARAAPWWSGKRWRHPTQTVIVQDQPLPAASFQMVWSNMALHGVADPPQLLTRWFDALQVDGFLMFSSLGPDTLRQLRPIYAALGWGPPGIDFVDMHDLGDMLVDAGFADPVMDQETLTLTWSTPGELLAELRGIGGNASALRFTGLRTPRWHRRLQSSLEALRGADGRLQLDFEVAYGHAFKVARKPAAAEQTTVSLGQMRELVRAPRNAR